MRAEDIPDVKKVDLVSFGALVENRYPDIKIITARTDDNILSFMRAEPEGCMVAEDDFAGVIGSSFSHVWGRVGWVGPISVLPTYQGRGVGKELVKSSLSHLDSRGCADIGLETMPENQVNMGMYLRIGLRPAGMVLVMGVPLGDPPAEDAHARDDYLIERFSEVRGKEDMLSMMRRLSDSLHPGLDYSPEVLAIHEHRAGDTLVAVRGNKLVGFSVVQTLPRREGMQSATVRAMAVHPSEGDVPVEPLLSASELLAREDRSAELDVPVPAVCSRAVDVMLSRGYQLVQTYERMMWLGSPGVSERLYNLCSWSG